MAYFHECCTKLHLSWGKKKKHNTNFLWLVDNKYTTLYGIEHTINATNLFDIKSCFHLRFLQVFERLALVLRLVNSQRQKLSQTLTRAGFSQKLKAAMCMSTSSTYIRHLFTFFTHYSIERNKLSTSNFWLFFLVIFKALQKLMEKQDLLEVNIKAFEYQCRPFVLPFRLCYIITAFRNFSKISPARNI